MSTFNFGKEYPDLLKEIYEIVDDYLEEGGEGKEGGEDKEGEKVKGDKVRILTYLQSEPIPDLPDDILYLITQKYWPPTTKTDLAVLHSLDRTGRINWMLFPYYSKPFDQSVKVISMPETTLEGIWAKLRAALDIGYYPVAIKMYPLNKLGNIRGMRDLFWLAVENKEYEDALEIGETNPLIFRDKGIGDLMEHIYRGYYEAVKFVMENFLDVYVRISGIYFPAEDIFELLVEKASLSTLPERDWLGLANMIGQRFPNVVDLKYLSEPKLSDTLVAVVKYLKEVEDLSLEDRGDPRGQGEFRKLIEGIVLDIKGKLSNPNDYLRLLINKGIDNSFVEIWEETPGPK